MAAHTIMAVISTSVQYVMSIYLPGVCTLAKGIPQEMIDGLSNLRIRPNLQDASGSSLNLLLKDVMVFKRSSEAMKPLYMKVSQRCCVRHRLVRDTCLPTTKDEHKDGRSLLHYVQLQAPKLPERKA